MAANFSMHSGDTKILEVTVRAASAAGSAAVDITGVAIRWQLARSATARPPLVSKEVGSGIVITDGAAGKFEITLEPEDTETLSGSFYHEAEIDDGGIISTVTWGTAKIEPDLVVAEVTA